MAKMNNEEPKVRTRTRRLGGGATMTKTVTKGKGMRKVEKSIEGPNGKTITSTKERKRTALGKSFTGSYEMKNPNATDYGVSYKKKDYSKTKMSSVPGGKRKKNVSYDMVYQYKVPSEGKAPSYTGGFTTSLRKEKSNQGKGKVFKMTNVEGYNQETGRKIKDTGVMRTKGKKSIISKLKKSMK